MPWTMPCTSVEIICGAAYFAVVAAPEALEESTPALVSQPWSRSTPAAAAAESSALWPVMPATTITDDEDGDGRDREQHERRRERARHVPVENADDGHRDHRDDERADHRPGDRVRLREQPDEPEDEREHADQQPGAAAEVAQPARRRERAGQLRPPSSVVAARGVHVASSLAAPRRADLIPPG